MSNNDFLELPGWEQEDYRFDENGDYYIKAKITTSFDTCPDCRVAIKRHDKRPHVVMDIPVRDKRVGIHFDQARYKCSKCEKILQHPLPGCDEKRRITARLSEMIVRETLMNNYAKVGYDVGVAETTVRNIFVDWMKVQDDKYDPETPEILGIDEIHLKKYLCVFTNIGKLEVVDLLENRIRTTVKEGLDELDKKKIKIVTMDMWEDYRLAVQEKLPHAMIVMDKFHVVKRAYDCANAIRIAIRKANPDEKRLNKNNRYLFFTKEKKLNDNDLMIREWLLSDYPVLKESLDARDRFRQIYECQSRIQAEQYFIEWRDSLSPDVREGFKPLINSFKDENVGRYIFNYFDTNRVTNAYTESINRLIRIIYLVGRNYEFKRLRAKVVYTNGLKSVKRDVYNRNFTFDHMIRFGEDSFDHYRSASILKLIEMFEDEAKQLGLSLSNSEKDEEFLFRENY